MSTAEQWTVDSVRAALGAKKVSARELTTEYYARIEKQNPELNAFLALCPERAYAQAERIDAKIARGEPLPPLAGVPMAIKDVISTRRMGRFATQSLATACRVGQAEARPQP